MCFGGGGGSPAPQNAPPPIVARNPDLTRASRLAPKKNLFDDDDVTGVEYGSSAKEGGAAAGKKVNTDALRIKLNTGTDTASTGQGGLNV